MIGFTFKKVTDIQTPRPENALPSCGASPAANSSIVQSRKIQSSMSSFTLTTTTATTNKPVATVPPQGPRMKVPGSKYGTSFNTDAASANGVKGTKETSDTSFKENISSLTFVVDDDDDFDMPVLAPVTPRSQRKREKESSSDSDEGIAPVRKHRSLVLSSDDENDTDISSGRANFPLSQQRSNFLINAKTSSALPECGSGNSKTALPQHQKGFCSSTPKMTPATKVPSKISTSTENSDNTI
ncbi:hypothetical protein C0Q70_00418 [Pomacea canaliculata]|uniref:Uncharacterized protein n=1 Tax=Pomacea canaliculata TaxID=400727 RepID=A0A2T7PWK5_POMCA|nr:hypothetical protein C0Q70_00418 [Pomacea canaliculata]